VLKALSPELRKDFLPLVKKTNRASASVKALVDASSLVQDEEILSDIVKAIERDCSPKIITFATSGTPQMLEISSPDGSTWMYMERRSRGSVDRVDRINIKDLDERNSAMIDIIRALEVAILRKHQPLLSLLLPLMKDGLYGLSPEHLKSAINLLKTSEATDLVALLKDELRKKTVAKIAVSRIPLGV